MGLFSGIRKVQAVRVEKVEYSTLPDFVTMREVEFEGEKIVRVVFRDADELLKLQPLLELQTHRISPVLLTLADLK